MKNNLEKKIFIKLGLIIALVICLTLLALYRYIVPDILKSSENEKIGIVEDAQVNVENYLSDRVKDIEMLRQVILDIGTDTNLLSSQLDKVAKNFHELEETYIFNNKEYTYGKTSINKEKIPSLKDMEVKFLDINSKTYIHTALIVNDENWNIVAKLNEDALISFIEEISGLTHIYDVNGKIIASHNSGINLNEAEINAINSKYETLNMSLIRHNDKIAVIKTIFPTGWNLVSITTKKDFFYNSLQTMYRIITVIVLIAIVFFVALVHFIKGFTKFSKQILSSIESVKNNRFDTSMLANGMFGDIAIAFQEMMNKIRGNYEELKVQTEELYERNWEIEETNKELEVSYQKIQQAINKLNEAEEKYYTLVRNLQEIICIIEMDGTITFINDAVKEVLLFSKEEVVGKNLDIIFEPELSKKLLTIMNRKLRKVNKISMELPVKRKDNKEIIVEVKLTYYLRNDGVDGVQAVVRDITKNRKLQNEIIHKNNELLTIYNISKSLSSTIELDGVFMLIVNEICKILSASYCMLRILDIKEKNLVLRAYTGTFFDGVDQDIVERYRLLKVEKVSDVLISKRIIQTDVLEEGEFTATVNRTKDEMDKVHFFTMVPICAKQKVLGMLTIGTREKVKDDNLNIMLSVANNAAVAIDNATLYENSKKYFLKTIESLIAAVEAKDKYTEGHSRRVAKYAEIIAKTMGMSKQTIDDLKIAGILHDVGKIGISDNILLKPSKLSDEEYEEVKQHPIISNRILYSVGLSEITMKAIACHHERYDGKGYPFGLKEDEISVECQIIAVADSFDAMTSTRAYRRALSVDEAMKELVKHKGTQFGPMVVDTIYSIYLNCPEDLERISEETELAV